MNEPIIGLSELVYNYSGKLNNLEGYLNVLESYLRQIVPYDSTNIPVPDLRNGDIEFSIIGGIGHNNLKFDDNLTRFSYLLDILNSSINGNNDNHLQLSSTNGTLKSR